MALAGRRSWSALAASARFRARPAHRLFAGTALDRAIVNGGLAGLAPGIASSNQPWRDERSFVGRLAGVAQWPHRRRFSQQENMKYLN